MKMMLMMFTDHCMKTQNDDWDKWGYPQNGSKWPVSIGKGIGKSDEHGLNMDDEWGTPMTLETSNDNLRRQ